MIKKGTTGKHKHGEKQGKEYTIIIAQKQAHNAIGFLGYVNTLNVTKVAKVARKGGGMRSE